jgi:hypothetical protein
VVGAQQKQMQVQMLCHCDHHTMLARHNTLPCIPGSHKIRVASELAAFATMLAVLAVLAAAVLLFVVVMVVVGWLPLVPSRTP